MLQFADRSRNKRTQLTIFGAALLVHGAWGRAAQFLQVVTAAPNGSRREAHRARAIPIIFPQRKLGFAFWASCRPCAANHAPAIGSTMPQSGSKWFSASPLSPHGL